MKTIVTACANNSYITLFFKKNHKIVCRFKENTYLCSRKKQITRIIVQVRAETKLALILTSTADNLAKFANKFRGNSSVGRAQPCQGWGRESESRFPLKKEFFDS